ncbi:MAG: hypothetical protein HYS13_23430 [Planctomycetia bacterium]|nr:hypothetical protein [Planctomycetia bacterium]
MPAKKPTAAALVIGLAAALQLGGGAAVLGWAQNSTRADLVEVAVPLATIAVVAMLAVWTALARGGLLGRVALMVCVLAAVSLALDNAAGGMRYWKSLVWMISLVVVASLLLLRGAGLRLELPRRGAGPKSRSAQFTLLDLLAATLAAGILLLLWQQPWNEPARGSPFLLAQALTYPVSAVCGALLCLWPDARPIDVLVRPLMLLVVSLTTAWTAILAINGLRTDLSTLGWLVLAEGALAAIPFLVSRACGARLEWSGASRKVAETAAEPAGRREET